MTNTTNTTKKNVAKVEMQGKAVSIPAEVQELAKELGLFYKHDFSKVNNAYMQRADRFAYYEFIRLRDEVLKLEHDEIKLETQIDELETELAELKASGKEKSIEFVTKQAKVYEKEEDLAKVRDRLTVCEVPLEKCYKQDIHKLVDNYAIAKAFYFSHISNLTTSNGEQVMAECEKLRGYVTNNADIIMQLASDKKTGDTRNVYVNLKADLQNVVNLILSTSEINMTIQNHFVAVVAGMMTVDIKEGKNTNVDRKRGGIQPAPAKAICKAICGLIVDMVEPRVADKPTAERKSRVLDK